MSVAVTRAILQGLAPDEAAALWKIQHDSGGPAEAGLFEEWLGATEANAIAWAALDDAWSMFDNADNPLFAELRHNALSRCVQRPIHRYVGAASALLLMIVASGILLLPRVGPQLSQSATRDEFYETRGDTRTVVLADGSQVELSQNTQMRVVAAKGHREVILDQGRAMFSVKHDQAHPFKVAVGQWSVTDVGTRFEVGLHNSEMRVALLQGGVQIDDGSHIATILRPGQLYVARAGQPGEIAPIETPAQPIAVDEMAEFNGDTLEKVVQKFNAVNATKLVIVDPGIAAFHITGRFSLGDPARFADRISQILAIRVTRVDLQRIELRANR